MTGPEPRTEGTLLGGRVRYAQPLNGYRTGIEPVLLAASIPARPGERVLEAGTGSGAGLLCLLARVSGLVAAGIELDPANADRARHNLAENGWPGTIHQLDVADAPGLGPVDHAFANPPWHHPAGTRPGQPNRALAKHQAGLGLAGWVAPLARAVSRRGTLTMALPAVLLSESLGLFAAAGFGAATVVPLWPRPGVPAKLVLLQGRRGPARTRLAAGLTLHGPEGYTAEADAILRGGAPLAP